MRRQQTRRGEYRLHDLDSKPRPKVTYGPFSDAAGLHNEPRESMAWEEPRRSMGPYAEQSDKAPMQNGYAVPDQQFSYDTGYHGGHQERPYGS